MMGLLQQGCLPQQQQGAGTGWLMLAAGDGGAWGAGLGVSAGDNRISAAASYSAALQGPGHTTGVQPQGSALLQL